MKRRGGRTNTNKVQATLKEMMSSQLINYQLSERTMDEKPIVNPHEVAVVDVGVLGRWWPLKSLSLLEAALEESCPCASVRMVALCSEWQVAPSRKAAANLRT